MRRNPDASPEQKAAAAKAAHAGLPDHDVNGFGEYGRNLRNWINGKGTTI